MTEQYGSVHVVALDDCPDTGIGGNDSVRLDKVSESDMKALMKYAAVATYIDTSIKILSFRYSVDGSADMLEGTGGLDCEQIVCRGMLGIIGG